MQDSGSGADGTETSLLFISGSAQHEDSGFSTRELRAANVLESKTLPGSSKENKTAMFSYIFMKILESRPHRYDWGIDFLTKGQTGKIKEHIVTNFVRPSMAVLDVGCGTGDLAVRAARAGALVTGVDISEGMLAVAHKRLRENRLENRVVLHHAGVDEIDSLFEEKSFDLKGIVGDQTSEAEALLHKLGFESFGHLFRSNGIHAGFITQDKSRCVNCNTCGMVCPAGVYGLAKNKKDIIIVDDSICLKCNGCVMQCPPKALSLS